MKDYVEIRSGRMELAINPSNGNIMRLKDRKTKRVHFDATGKEHRDEFLFRVIIPSETCNSYFADNRCNKPVITKKQEGILLTYPNLKADNKKTGIAVHLNIFPRKGTEEICITMEVENNGSYTINEVCCPSINRWQGGGDEALVVGGYHQFNPRSFPLSSMPYLRLRHRQFYAYPANMFAPWFDLSNSTGGFSCINYMDRPRNCGVGVENMDGYERGCRLSCVWAHWPLIKPGQRWTSPAIGLSVHEGDWHTTADRYSQWTQTWFKAPPTPETARVSIGTQTVFLRGFDGTAFSSLDAVPEIARVGRKYGVDRLCIWDHATLGNYTRHGDVELIDYTKEEEDTLRKSLLLAKKEGTDVSSLINFRLINHSEEFLKKKLFEDVLKNYDGTPRMEAYAAEHSRALHSSFHIGPTCYLANFQTKSHRKRVLDLTQKYIKLGYNSMFYDQPFEYYPNYNIEHPSDTPDGVYESVVTLLAEIRQMLYKNDPTATIMGEQCDAFAAQYIDIWMSWFSQFDMAKLAAYSLPMTTMSWVVDSDKGEANRAFAAGLHLLLCTHGIEKTMEAEPKFAQHIKQLADLRKATAKRTVLGRFRDQNGIEIVKGEELAVGKFESPEGSAVIVSDYQGKGGHVKINIDSEILKGKNNRDRGLLFRLDGSREKLAKTDKLELVLKPNEVVVAYL